MIKRNLKRLSYYFISLIKLSIHVRWFVYKGFLLLFHKRTIVSIKNKFKFIVRNAMDLWIIKETILDNDYLKFGYQISPGDVIIDVGAFIGDFTVLAATLAKDVKVIAIEPIPANYQLLLKNLELNKVTNVETFDLALYQKVQIDNIFIDQSNLANTSIDTTNKHQQKTIVKSLQFSKFLQQQKITRCDLLKLDCEGYEYDLLMNLAPEVLKRVFKNIILEYHDKVVETNHHQLANYLKKLGFSIIEKKGKFMENVGFIFAKNLNV